MHCPAATRWPGLVEEEDRGHAFPLAGPWWSKEPGAHTRLENVEACLTAFKHGFQSGGIAANGRCGPDSCSSGSSRIFILGFALPALGLSKHPTPVRFRKTDDCPSAYQIPFDFFSSPFCRTAVRRHRLRMRLDDVSHRHDPTNFFADTHMLCGRRTVGAHRPNTKERKVDRGW